MSANCRCWRGTWRFWT